MNRLLRYGFVAAFLLFFLLVTITARVEWISAYSSWIIWLNIVVVSFLGIITLIRLRQLWKSIRRQQYGSRLARRLFSVLAVASIVPCLVVYGLSYRFLDSAIESWFKLEIDQAVHGGLELAKQVINEEAKRLEQAANTLASLLSTMSSEEQRQEIDKWRELIGVEEITLFDTNLQFYSRSHNDNYSLSPDLPEAFTVQEIGYRATAHIETQNRRSTTDISHTGNDSKTSTVPVYHRIRVLVRIPASNRVDKQSPLSLSILPPSLQSSQSLNALSLDQHLSASTNLSFYLQIIQNTPERIRLGSQQLTSAYQSYGELKQGRDGLKKLFLIALTILLALTLIMALSLAFHYSNRFIRPLAILGEGTRAVARGDFSRRLLEGPSNHDEFDQVIMSFNDMLAELKQAQDTAKLAQREMNESHTFLENVLNHLKAGVLIFGYEEVEKNGKEVLKTEPITSDLIRLLFINEGAKDILGQDLSAMHNKPLSEWETLRPFANAIYHQLRPKPPLSSQEKRDASDLSLDHTTEWIKQLDVRLPQGFRSLMLRGTQLPNDQRWVIVFDDISELLRIQHLQTWSGMAQRLAHEIKNPLTPIQLSAERMTMKLGDKLSGYHRDFFERSIGTIVSQVDAIKTLVNQFREMARPASTQLEVFHIDELLKEVVALYDDKQVKLRVSDHKHQVFADRHQLRQVLHNLILNAQQANCEKRHELNLSRIFLSIGEGFVDRSVEAHFFKMMAASTNTTDTTTNRFSKDGIWIEVTDIGGGFNQEMIDRAFEPNKTSKIKGSGLGLAIVKKIIEEHRGSIQLSNHQWLAGSKGYEWDDISEKGARVCGARVLIWLPRYRPLSC